jgi:hypothetical protein
MLGQLTAVEKVWAFLMDMKDRLVLEADLDGHPVVTLPVPRQDVVDYLGIRPDMLRRAIQSLRRQGAIELVTPSRIKLLSEAPLVWSATSRLNQSEYEVLQRRLTVLRHVQPVEAVGGGVLSPTSQSSLTPSARRRGF